MTRVQLSFLRSLGGVAAAVVPFAIGVHLAAEALALGAGAAAPAFWWRHAYLLVPLALALWSLGHTVGLAAPRSERVRRCALLRGRLHGAGAASTIATFTIANLAFFGATQWLEGEPIAGASIGTALAAAVLGSILSALLVFFWGRSLVARAIAAVVRRPRCPRRRPAARPRPLDGLRAAATAFSLFVPNRPPPSTSPA